jgi:hypothetical protein
LTPEFWASAELKNPSIKLGAMDRLPTAAVLPASIARREIFDMEVSLGTARFKQGLRGQI